PISEDTLRIYNEAKAIIDQEKNGKDFATLANLNTQDPGNQISPDSGRGGDLGWFGKGQMVGPFEEESPKAMESPWQTWKTSEAKSVTGAAATTQPSDVVSDVLPPPSRVARIRTR
ncbi:MAG: peptidylprolyl isomerase, partial [Bacteroidetes bacterium]|nr:peptidylprolyl isomerase [Bacteroidota bacterium]